MVLLALTSSFTFDSPLKPPSKPPAIVIEHIAKITYIIYIAWYGLYRSFNAKVCSIAGGLLNPDVHPGHSRVPHSRDACHGETVCCRAASWQALWSVFAMSAMCTIHW